MYQEPTPNQEKMIEKACDVLINNCSKIHPFNLECLLKEIYADYVDYDLSSSYHKQYFPHLISLIEGVKRHEHKRLVDHKKRVRIREAMQRRRKL